MPDIAMCGSLDCPLRPICYRSPDSGTEQSWRQSWSLFRWRFAVDGTRIVCDDFWPVTNGVRASCATGTTEAGAPPPIAGATP